MYGFLCFRIYKFYLAVYWMIMYQSIMLYVHFFLRQCAKKTRLFGFRNLLSIGATAAVRKSFRPWIV